MSDLLNPANLIVLAVIAVGMFFGLRRIAASTTGSRPSRPIPRSPHHGQRQTGFMQTWASLRHPYPTIAVGTQSIPKPWMSIIAKRG